VLTFGVVALGVTDVQRAAAFWSAALGYTLREDGFGGWATVLVPPGEAGTAIALQLSQTPLQARPRLHFDLHAADASEQEAEATRLIALGSALST
jgi:catechol 2,3-dioxygenase-like lactoylglutathione lyase family enzyme